MGWKDGGVALLRACLMKYLILFIFLSGCASPAVGYAKARNPGCNVVVLDENRDGATVRVECPGIEPFEQTFRKQ